MKLMMAVDLPVELPSSRSDAPETLLRDWILLARHNNALHEATRAHYAGLLGVGLITAVVLGSAGGLINILLGSTSAKYGAGVTLNISHVALRLISVVSATIISTAKQRH
jgi:hypothetical protein